MRRRWSWKEVPGKLKAELWLSALFLAGLPRILAKPSLMRLACALSWTYPLGRAYRVALFAREETFGETPLSTALQILSAAHVRAGQSLEELGSGPGRLSLVGASVFGLECLAVERILHFVERGNSLSQKLGLEVTFVQLDLARWRTSGFDWVYLCNVGIPDPVRDHLAQELAGTRTRILSTGQPLDIPTHTVGCIGKFPFSWGRVPVFLQQPIWLNIADTRSLTSSLEVG